MIVQVFLALPFFTKDEQALVKDICMEFIPGTPRFCTDLGNNPVHLVSKVLAMVQVNPTPGCDK